MNDFKLTTADGTPIAASLYQSGFVPKQGVIINSATGVGRLYYQHFAQFLANQGYAVITYDYRGIGDSISAPKRDKSLTMQAWGEQDFNAVIKWATDQYPQLNWHCIGHSVGGQLVGLAPLNHKLASVYCVAAQSGNWRNWGLKNKPKLLAIWYFLIPVLSRILGYFPGVLMGGENLPEQVARQWASWCRNPNYICDQEGKAYRPYFSSLNKKMRFLQMADDHAFAPMKAVRQLHDFYENADRSIMVIEPKQVGQKFIGHFGFFKKQSQQGLWPHVVDWLEAFTKQKNQPVLEKAAD